jgi:hypothetical protein
LILKCAPVGWNQNDYDVVEDGVIVGRIFFLDAVGPKDLPGCRRVAITGRYGARLTATRSPARR